MSQALVAKLQAASTEYQKLQTDLGNAVDARTRLDAQLSENEQVKAEFAKLTPSNTVYKLIGPTLMPQDQTEAKGNVNTRIEFIQSEIKRVEGQLKEFEAKSEQKKNEIVELQTVIQQSQQGEAPA
ncbi:prefoldin subunit 6, partial [Coniophora puteana RWD-64-598 SS2]